MWPMSNPWSKHGPYIHLDIEFSYIAWCFMQSNVTCINNSNPCLILSDKACVSWIFSLTKALLLSCCRQFRVISDHGNSTIYEVAKVPFHVSSNCIPREIKHAPMMKYRPARQYPITLRILNGENLNTLETQLNSELKHDSTLLQVN